MSYFLKIIALVLVLATTDSCEEKKQAKLKEKEALSKTADMNSDKEMVAQGFMAAQLKANKSESCPMLLITKTESMDAINIKDFDISDGDKVWVKVRRLRMKNRCNDGNPVEILDVKVR